MSRRSILVNGRRTSLTLESDIWEALDDIALREGVATTALIGTLDLRRGEMPLTAALRVYVLSYFRAATDPALAYKSVAA